MADGLPTFEQRYRLLNKLGEGGYGIVWRAHDSVSDTTVAVKLLRGAGGEIVERRFELEAHALGRLKHPHCVRYLDHGRNASGLAYLVTEFVPGATLRTWMRGSHSVAELREVGAQIAQAISHAHREGVVHRDLKFANVMVRDTKDGPHVTVLDFGLAKLTGRDGPALTKTGEVFGTPGCMSPEQLYGRDIGPPTDVYSLGAMLFEMFEGKPPFVGESSLELAMAHIKLSPPAPESAPADLRQLILSMLAKDQAQRPAIETVARALSHRTSAPSAMTQRGPKSRGAIVALVLGGILAASVVLYTNSRPADTIPSAGQVSPQVRPNPLSTVGATTVPNESEVLPEDEVGAVADGAEGSDLDCGTRGRVDYIPPAPGDERGMRVYLPSDETTGAASVLITRDVFQHTGQYVEFIPFRCMAERYNTVLLVPEEAENAVWSGSTDLIRVTMQVETATERFELDPKRRFALGIGQGGKLVRQLPCTKLDFRASIVWSYPLIQTERCEQQAALLELIPRETTISSLAGTKISPPKEWRETLQRGRDCQPNDESVFETHGVSCAQHACKVPLTTCISPRGRAWDGLDSVLPSALIEEPTPSLHEMAWAYFNSFDTKSQRGKTLTLKTSSGTEFWAYIPATAPPINRPFVTVFRDVPVLPRELVSHEPFIAMAEKYGYVLIVPIETGLVVWDGDDLQGVRSGLPELVDEFELDLNRSFVLGFGSGGKGVESLACSPELRPKAVVTMGHHRAADKTFCDIALPRLAILDRGGKFTGLHVRKRASIEEQFDELTRTNRCTNQSRSEKPKPDVVCDQHVCDIDLTTCTSERGRHWAGLTGLDQQPTPSLHEETWAFFHSHDALSAKTQ